jgi:hypothetical protein
MTTRVAVGNVVVEVELNPGAMRASSSGLET